MKWFTPKYRIKIVTDGNDKITYYPQKRTWYGWRNFTEYSNCFNKFPKKCSYIADVEKCIKEDYHLWLSQQTKKVEYKNIDINLLYEKESN